MKTLLRRQTIAPHCNGTLSLPVKDTHSTDKKSLQVGIVSPYWQHFTNQIGTGRVTNLTLTLFMARTGIVIAYQGDGGLLGAQLASWEGSTFYGVDLVDFDGTSATTPSQVAALAVAACQAWATTNSISFSSIKMADAASDTGLSGIPKAAIADAPADAITNYNVVTTLLGAVTGAVNTANGKQNDIATKLNTLLSELRSAGVISA